MAFNVQDSDGLVEGANAYVEVDDMRDYFADRGVSFAQEDDALEIAIIKATDYIDTRYSFRGFRKAEDQETEFPRYGDTVLPSRIKTACYLYAQSALTGDLWKTGDEVTEGKVSSKSEQVGPIVESVTYANVLGGYKAFSQADEVMMKSGYLLNPVRVIGRA